MIMAVINIVIFSLIFIGYFMTIRPNLILLLAGLMFPAAAMIFSQESALFSLFVILAFIAAFTVLARKGDLFAPGNIFLIIWLFAVGICSLQITIYETPWSDYMWFTVLTGMIGFLIPCFAASSFIREASGDINSRFKDLRSRLKYRWDPFRFILITLPIFAVSCFIFVYQYRVASVVPIFASSAGMSIDYARIYVAINSVFQRLALTQIPIFIACVVFILAGARGKARTISWIMAGLSFILLLSYMSRLFLGTAIITCFIAYHYLGKNLDLRKTMIAGLLVIICIVTVPIYIRGVLSRDYLVDIGFKPGLTWAAPLYLGISMNYFVLERMIDQVGEGGHTYGWMSLYPIRALFGDKEKMLSYGEGLTPGATWMTTTILGEFYSDFGFFGVFGGMFLLGLLCSWVYIRMIDNPTPFNIIWHSYNTWLILFSIYSNGFILFDYPWNLLVLFMINFFAGHFNIKKTKEKLLDPSSQRTVL